MKSGASNNNYTYAKRLESNDKSGYIRTSKFSPVFANRDT